MNIVEIPLTQGKVARIDEADAELVGRYKWHAVYRRQTWYAATSAELRKGRSIYMHRFIMGAEAEHVDHRDHDGLNNTRKNLRVCSNAENRRNTQKTRGAAKYKGVSQDKRQPGRPWSAYIWKDNRKISLGSYETQEEAARAYNAAAIRHHGEFASLNVIEGMAYEESITAPVRNRKPGRVCKRSTIVIGSLE